MKRGRTFVWVSMLSSAAMGLAPIAMAEDVSCKNDYKNDYSTETRAEYVFGCMQVNGNSRLALERCSCSIDVIASILTRDQYIDAETIMSMKQRGGESMAVFDGPLQKAKVKALKLAQVEGELRCF